MATHILSRKQTAPTPTKAAHKPLKGCPENDFYDVVKTNDCFQIVLKSTGMVVFTTVNKTIAVETLEGMLA